ncbi:hypothetical protein ACOME3_008389 [Neoechinorhynchus agilis]
MCGLMNMTIKSMSRKQLVDQAFYPLLLSAVNDRIEMEGGLIYRRHQNKIIKLTNNRLFVASEHTASIRNISGVVLPNEVLELLSYGPDFIPYNPPKRLDYRIKLEKIAMRTECDNLNVPIWKLERFYESVFKNRGVDSNISQNMLKGVNMLKSLKQIVPVKIDKGYGYCAVSQQQYTNAGEEILNGVEFTRISRCPTSSREKEFNSFL